MTDLLFKALPAIISAACLGVASWTAAGVRNVLRDYKTLKESQRNQLKADIVAMYERVSERGWITPMSLDTVNRMADSYFELGGNHYVHALMDRMNNEMEVRGAPVPKN